MTALDLKTGQILLAVALEGDDIIQVKLVTDLPLSDKVAMRDIESKKTVIEYGRPIGQATKTISAGAHVHTQNLKTLLWGGKSQIVDPTPISRQKSTARCPGFKKENSRGHSQGASIVPFYQG